MTTSSRLIVLPEPIVYLYNGYVYWRFHLLFMTYFTIKANYNCPELLIRVIPRPGLSPAYMLQWR